MRLIDADKFELFEYKRNLEYDEKSFDAGVRMVLEQIDAAPTVDVEPVRHAHWIRYAQGSGIYCSNCRRRRRYMDIKDKYCPKCGCKMDEVV